MLMVESVNAVEDRRLVEELLREMEVDAAITASPARLKVGVDHSPSEPAMGMQFQRCGGGRRVVRKKIGSN